MGIKFNENNKSSLFIKHHQITPENNNFSNDIPMPDLINTQNYSIFLVKNNNAVAKLDNPNDSAYPVVPTESTASKEPDGPTSPHPEVMNTTSITTGTKTDSNGIEWDYETTTRKTDSTTTVTTKSTSGQTNVSYEVTATYDGDNVIKEVKNQYIENKLSMITTTEYTYDGNGRVSGYTVTYTDAEKHNNGTETATRTYNPDGSYIEHVVEKDEDGKVEGVSKILYDKDGDEIRTLLEVEYDRESGMVIKKTTQYDVNENGTETVETYPEGTNGSGEAKGTEEIQSSDPNEDPSKGIYAIETDETTDANGNTVSTTTYTDGTTVIKTTYPDGIVVIKTEQTTMAMN